MTLTLAHLPSELYATILDHVPPADGQHTNAALAMALPRSPVPRTHIFRDVRLRTAERVALFARYVRHAPPVELARIRRFALEAWTVDADVAINAMRALTSVERLLLCIGPSFAPEHTEELVARPWSGLQYLSIRFRPYVQKATYYQFLKGAYFDSTLLALAAWPAPAPTTLSIVQDPLDPTLAPTTFAQPIVFFRLDPLSALASSALGTCLHALRVRLPHREVVRFMLSAPGGALPALRTLDLGTSRVRTADAALALARLPHLHTLLLDGCGTVPGGGELVGDEWTSFGRSLALAGLQRAREREKALKEYREAHTAAAPRARQERRVKKGRKGLATATISLRERPGEGSTPVAGSSSAPQDSDASPPPKLERVRVLPPAPALRALAITASAHVPLSAYAALADAFALGWTEGAAAVGAARARLRTSAAVGSARVMRFVGPDDSEDVLPAPLDGLVDVGPCDAEFDTDVLGAGTPVLCLAGSAREGEHAEGCAHMLAGDAFGDEL